MIKMTNKRIDWHVHSRVSDGFFSPVDIVRIAKEFEIDISLTDHDTIDGIAEFLTAAHELEYPTITPGLELSLNDGGTNVHLLCYGVDHVSEELLTTLTNTQNQRTTLVEQMLKRAQKAGRWQDINIDQLRIQSHAYISKIHVALELRNKGYPGCDSVEDALKVVNGEYMYVAEPLGLDITSGINLLREAGSIISLPHVHELKKEEAEEERFIAWLKDNGLTALEAISSKYDDAQTVRYISLARKFGLKITVGSDFHWEQSTPGRKIGVDLEYHLNKRILRALGLKKEEIYQDLVVK